MRNRSMQGNVLVAAIVLLLLASVVTLMSLNVGLFEQRASGNEARTRLVAEVAEAAVAQGAEWIRQQSARLDPSPNWARCVDLPDTTQFPCGAIADPARRATTWYWRDAAPGIDRNLDGRIDAMDARLLPFAEAMPESARLRRVGAFDVTQGVGVVACRLAVASPQCTLDAAAHGDAIVYTLVGVGGIPGEGARATVAQTFVRMPAFVPDPRQPAIVASGSILLDEGLHVVANPNGGGDGVPVSAWSRGDVAKHGATTCEAGGFFDNPAHPATPTLEQALPTCDDCRCPVEGNSLVDAAHAEGIDIVDVDGGEGLNVDVPPGEFPCDLFRQLFGVDARRDVDGDGFCESPMPIVRHVSPGMVVASLPPDDAFLYTHATHVVPRDANAAAWMHPRQALPGAFPDAGISGLVWCQADCDIAAGEQLGSQSGPVVLVADGPLRIDGRVFGIVFARDPAGTLDAATGGNADVRLQGGIVYGAVVAQGTVRGGGTSAVVFSGAVLDRFRESLPPIHLPMPGAWSDRPMEPDA